MTEVEALLLFDEGITSNKRTLIEQMMNIDLKAAYDYGMTWIKQHGDITVEWLITLASKVMAHTGADYHTMIGDFSAAKGKLRKLNVTAGVGGKSYLSYQKVPAYLSAFCQKLNQRRRAVLDHINSQQIDAAAIYGLSFWAHYELVTIHPWADGNGRTSRLLMNLLQMEFGLLPTKILKEDKAEYIQSLIDTREQENINIFVDFMSRLHCQHLKNEIDQFMASMTDGMVDKSKMVEQMMGKWSITPALANKLADIMTFAASQPLLTTELIVRQFALTATTAKRYLRQLTAFGYLKAEGGNRNKTYKIIIQ